MNVRESQAATRQTERACMSGQAAFLKAVIAAPDDDLPRLIYADWLDERGDPRGEFIRCQIELEQYRPLVVNGETYDVTTTGDAGHADALRRRERELQSCPLSQWREWCNPLIDLGAGWTWTMRRGFVESVTCTLADWLAHGPAVVRAAPVQAVQMSGRRPVHGRTAGLFYWYRWPQYDPERYHLAPPLFAALRGGSMEFDNTRGYPTEAAALADLSAACIAWAKAEADRNDAWHSEMARINDTSTPLPLERIEAVDESHDANRGRRAVAAWRRRAGV
jgi:uncharacterized protein (TIGR02996 family)